MIALALGGQITVKQTAALPGPEAAPSPTNVFPSALHDITQAAPPMHQGKLFTFAQGLPATISAKVAIGTTIEGSPHHDSEAKQIATTRTTETQASSEAATSTSNGCSSPLDSHRPEI
jgi:hypothetical protein